MKAFKFSDSKIDFGLYEGETQEAAQEAFAVDHGFESWSQIWTEGYIWPDLKVEGGYYIEEEEVDENPFDYQKEGE